MRVCKNFEADKTYFEDLRLAKMMKNDDKGTCENAAQFCINVMKNNDSILLSQLIGKDLNARYYVKNKSLNEMIINEK